MAFQVVGRALLVELPLIKDGLEEQRLSLLALQKITWTSQGEEEVA